MTTKLKLKTESVFRVDYNEFDSFVQKIYGQRYSVVARNEWCNDSQHRITAEKTTLSTYEQAEIDDFINIGDAPSVWTLFTDLANKGYIEEGTYSIEVCW